MRLTRWLLVAATGAALAGCGVVAGIDDRELAPTTTGAGGGSGGGGRPGGQSGSGGNGNPDCLDLVRGPKMVWLDVDFCIDQTEVTNAQYREFLDAPPPNIDDQPHCQGDTHTPTGFPVAGQDDFPVANVDWCDAYAFCRWAGKRLCGRVGQPGQPIDYSDDSIDRNEWVHACTNQGHNDYPWGNNYQDVCNGAQGTAVAEVKSFGDCVTSPPQVFDLIGNVTEWINDCGDSSVPGTPACRPRGGAFGDDLAYLACAEPDPDYPLWYDVSIPTGIRCCADP